uniref:Uncharacterized protein n=1 Tax=Ignisphaera aggregans TaxID=334771 RepID=A0A7J3YU98_9CREN
MLDRILFIVLSSLFENTVMRDRVMYNNIANSGMKLYKSTSSAKPINVVPVCSNILSKLLRCIRCKHCKDAIGLQALFSIFTKNRIIFVIRMGKIISSINIIRSPVNKKKRRASSNI